ncbi:TcpQ domain-containing protein [Escherichia coli]|uniref:TcpQ domain-containing protein n=1 Tax=Escherichia coli TaxID=562 RepID=UPI000BE20672|nr:TcpQ domain-containing protein [Escherichia coli]CAD6083349.1 lipoprotein [Escherichia coli]CAD6084989.1 lipoprotein [Escherichia coli]CAD6148473.1 lipoprotein [Escherichia coli]
MKRYVAIIATLFFVSGSYASNDVPSSETFGQLLYSYANKEKKEALKSQKKISIIEMIAANSVSPQSDSKKNQSLIKSKEIKKKEEKTNDLNVDYNVMNTKINTITSKQKIVRITNDKMLNENNINANNNLLNWSVDRNQDLLNILNKWGQSAGWDIVWKSDYSYRILTAASFSNVDFVTAVQRLFESMGDVKPKLYIKFYMGNKVLMISDKSDF